VVFGVISDVASGIITRDWRSGFKWRKEDVEAFSGDGVQMEKRRCCGIFWRTGFILAIASYRQATGVQIGEWGSLFGKKESGVQMQRSEDRLHKRKFSGFKKMKKEKRKFRGSRKA
jgi:hypothetical protein